MAMIAPQRMGGEGSWASRAGERRAPGAGPGAKGGRSSRLMEGSSWCPGDDRVLGPVVVVAVGVVEGVVQAAALLAAGGALHDQRRHVGDVAQLDHVARHLEPPVVVADLLAEQ